MKPTEHWREIVLARQRQMDAAYARLGRTSDDYWARRADRFRAARPAASYEDAVLRRAAKLAGPEGTVLDVGAGTGRYTLALSPRVHHVTAVEPAHAMAMHLREAANQAGLTNVTVVEQRWEEAKVEPADVVLCAHVLYPIADVAPFIHRLEAHALRSVMLAMMVTWAEPPLMAELWRRYHAEERRGQPEAFNAIAVLHELGIPANVRVYPLERRLPVMWSFADLDEAMAAVREHLILPADAGQATDLRETLASALVPVEGRLTVPQPERSVACIWWDRDGPRRLPL